MSGRVAWRAYREAVGGKSWEGNFLPGWDELGEVQKAGWKAATEATQTKVCENGCCVATRANPTTECENFRYHDE